MERIKLGIVTGSGINLFPLLNKTEKSYSLWEVLDIHASNVEGHSYRITEGWIDNIPTIICSGRIHAYEGYGIEQIDQFVQYFVKKGITHLISINAVGSLHTSFPVGAFVSIQKIISIPYVGFYLPATVIPTWIIDDFPRANYVWVTGPNYETKSELRYFKGLGGDVVGMSGGPEAFCAIKHNLHTAVLSCITNFCFTNKPLLHHDVVTTARMACERVLSILREVITRCI